MPSAKVGSDFRSKQTVPTFADSRGLGPRFYLAQPTSLSEAHQARLGPRAVFLE